MSLLVITGASGGSTQGANAPNRLNIEDLVKNVQQFSLYIQALQAMQKDGQADLASYFQISGIHGLPYVSWDGGNPDPVSQDGWEGYCTHGSVLFPVWHRPYMMLYEQVMQQHAIETAKTYQVDQDVWQKAAADLRLPFWDWASNSVPPPEVISLKQVTITKPDGTTGSVDNPLYHYAFHPIDSSFPAPYNRWSTTLRQPTSTGPNATDNVARLTKILQNVQSDVRTKTYNLLTRVTTWPAFSNHSVDDGGSSSNSLEAIHDGIHVDVGGNGQMADPSVAAFDPIFYLHHANVDRMLSLWSALHPDVWVSNGPEEDGTWTIPPNTDVGPDSDLTPFWNTQQTFWASTGLHDTASLGYTYPDFNGLDMSNSSQVQAAIANIVDQLYSGSFFSALAKPGTGVVQPSAAKIAQPPAPAKPTATATAAPAAPAAAPHAKANPSHPANPAPPAAAAAHPAAAPAHPAPAPAPAPHVTAAQPVAQATLATTEAHTLNTLLEWTVHVKVKKYELGTTFSVLFFLGTVPDDPEDWKVSDNYVGAVHAFVNSTAARCANCRQRPDLMIEGFVHLNEAIAKHSHLHTFEPNVVEPYLKNNLHWRVQKANGEAAQLHSLEIEVVATPLTLPPGAIFPVPGHRRHYHGITHGRPGGSRHGHA